MTTLSIPPAASPRRWPRRLRALLIAAAGLLAAVYGMQWVQGAHRQFSRTSEWYTGAPADEHWSAVDASLVLDVKPALRQGCIALLAERDFVALSDAGLAELAETKSPVPVGLLPYLIRSVQVSRYHHTADVSFSAAGAVWTKTETVSRWPLLMLERPMIVWLKRPPAQLFVDAVVYETPEDLERSESPDPGGEHDAPEQGNDPHTTTRNESSHPQP